MAKTALPDRLVKEVQANRRLYQSDPEHPVLLIVFDACRYDSFQTAYTGQVPGTLHKAYTSGMWTLPGHEALVRGSLPFNEDMRPSDILANEYNGGYYPLPQLHDNSFGAVSLAYLADSQATACQIPNYFNHWTCFARCTAADAVFSQAEDRLAQYRSTDFFGLLNLGETHFPYNHYTDDFQTVMDRVDTGELSYADLHRRQEQACSQLLDQLAAFREAIPAGTQVVVTADHGELFGENGGYGHNPDKRAVFHKKLFEVPLLTWIE